MKKKTANKHALFEKYVWSQSMITLWTFALQLPKEFACGFDIFDEKTNKLLPLKEK